MHKPHIIVIGNEKGGAGKTTTSMHLLTSLLHLGFKVSSVDLDCRQKSLSRYLENRETYSSKHGLQLLSPKHFTLNESSDKDGDIEQLKAFMDKELESCDFLLIDTPGSNTSLSSFAHSMADSIITPINDSFLDLDVIAQIEADTLKIIRPSFYAQAIPGSRASRACQKIKPARERSPRPR